MDLSIKYIENSIYLLIPLAILFILLAGFRKRKVILEQLKWRHRPVAEIVKVAFMVAGILLIAVGLLGPVKQEGAYEVKQKGLDIFMLMDTSKSMLAQDILPDRLTREKDIVNRILNGLEGDRIGFIPFSSSAYVQMPLTTDYKMASMFLDVVDTNMIGGGSSNVDQAIDLALKTFGKMPEGRSKVLIVISDGEEHDTLNKELLDTIMKQGIKVYTVGVGTSQGGLIPITDSNGSTTGYKKDNQGNPVITKLNDQLLKELAQAGHGNYYPSQINGSEVDALLKDINTLQRTEGKTKEVKRYNHLYMYPVGLGLCLFLLGYLVPIRREKNEKA